MRPDDVPQTAILAAQEALQEFAPIDIGKREIASIIAAALTDTGNTPNDYEVWRDALTLAVSERSYIDDDGISSSGLLARAEWFRNELNLGPRPTAGTKSAAL